MVVSRDRGSRGEADGFRFPLHVPDARAREPRAAVKAFRESTMRRFTARQVGVVIAGALGRRGERTGLRIVSSLTRGTRARSRRMNENARERWEYFRRPSSSSAHVVSPSLFDIELKRVDPGRRSSPASS